MLASIVHSLSSGLGEILDSFLNLFLNALGMRLSSFVEIFPLLSTFYTYLRSFAVALTAIVAGRALATFWFGSVDNNAKDNPLVVLLKTFFAVAAVYWGGYVLEYIVYLGSIPYDYFLGIEAVTGKKFYFWEFVTGFVADVTASGVAIGNLALGLGEIFLLIIISWNLFKLIVEVCERWLMVGILVYTSPLIYCTIPSNETSGIFKRWVSMFVGSVLQMSLSVMFLKLIISGFNVSEASSIGSAILQQGNSHFVIRLLMILAMCKIAQRIDTYLQQLGIGVATTGGSMIDDLLAGARGLNRLTGALGGKGGGSEGGAKSILGNFASRTNLGAGLRAAASAYKETGSVVGAAKAGAQGYWNNFRNNSGVGRATNAYRQAKEAAKARKEADGFVPGQKNAQTEKKTAQLPGKTDATAAGQQSKKQPQQGDGKPADAQTTKPKQDGEKPIPKKPDGEAETAMGTVQGEAASKLDEKEKPTKDIAAADKENSVVSAIEGHNTGGKQREDQHPAEKPESATPHDEQAGEKGDKEKPAALDAKGKGAERADSLSVEQDKTATKGDDLSRMNGKEEVPSLPEEKADVNASADGGASRPVDRANEATPANEEADTTGGAKQQKAVDSENGDSGVKGEQTRGRRNMRDAAESAVGAVGVAAETVGSNVGYAMGAFANSPWGKAAGGLASGLGYMYGLDKQPNNTTDDPRLLGNMGAPTKEDIREAQNDAKVNAAAVDAQAREYSTGGGIMPQDVYDDAEQARNGQKTAHPLRYGDNYRELGTRNNDGKIFEADGSGNITPSVAAAAAGVSIAGKDDEEKVTDRCGGAATSDWIAQSLSRSDINADGRNSYATLPEKADFVADKVAAKEPEIRQAAADEASKAKKDDAATIKDYESSMTKDSSSGGVTLQGIKSRVDSFKPSLEASQSDPAKTESTYGQIADSVKAAVYAPTVRAGEQRVNAARKQVEAMQKSGVDRESSEYQQAEAAYAQAREQLDGYKAAYGRSSTPGTYTQGSSDPARRQDQETMRAYERSMPKTSAGSAAVQYAHDVVDAYENKGGSLPEQRSAQAAAESAYDRATQSTYGATVAAGEQRVNAARQQVESMKASGVDSGSPEYQKAEAAYSQAQKDLDGYKIAYSRFTTPGSYAKMEEESVARQTASERDSAASTYNAAQEHLNRLLNNTISSADVFTKARALCNPNYILADLPETRQLAYDVFKAAIPDIKPDTEFTGFSMADLPVSSTNAANLEMAGGRAITVNYTRNDGTTGQRVFYNDVAATALSPNERSMLSVFRSADGREWLTNDPELKNRTANASGRQFKRDNAVRNFFAMLRNSSKNR